jgi:dTMP kinase
LKRKKGLFITFEGTEGAGKSTQQKYFCTYLKDRGIDYRFTREPGGSTFGGIIRKHLLNPNLSIFPKAELFLFLADRAQHVEEIIRPALEKGMIVVCDRYIDSTLAYQGGGRQMDWKFLEKLNDLSADRLKPDLTLLFDLPIHEGFKRKYRNDRNWAGDRIEKEKREFHERVRKAFLKIALSQPRRVKVIDSSKSVEEVKKEMFKVVKRALPGCWREKIFG